MKAKFVKQYSNYVGNVFVRFEVTRTDGPIRTEDVRIREGRQGIITMTRAEAKAEAIRRVESGAL